MKNVHYLNLSEAIRLITDFQSIIGKSYPTRFEGNFIISSLVAAPDSPILKWQFLRILYSGVDPAEAIKINMNKRYDVLLLPEPFFNPTRKINHIIDLRSYLLLNSSKYDLNALRLKYGVRMFDLKSSKLER